MSKTGRQLQVGDDALTDFNGRGITLVRITERHENTRSQSGICFCVNPMLKGGHAYSLYDADWFEPAPKDML
jgi:hypothetical protein